MPSTVFGLTVVTRRCTSGHAHVQGFGGPACARMLTTWFASKERGTYWGLWNIAHNLGGFLAPIVAGTAAGMFGWRYGMFVPGIAGFAMGLYVLFATSDSPEKEGYQPVEIIKKAPAKKGEEEQGAHTPCALHGSACCCKPC